MYFFEVSQEENLPKVYGQTFSHYSHTLTLLPPGGEQ